MYRVYSPTKQRCIGFAKKELTVYSHNKKKKNPSMHAYTVAYSIQVYVFGSHTFHLQAEKLCLSL